MKKRYIFIGLGTLAVLVLLYLGSRNKVDPEWVALDEKLDADYLTLAAANDSLNLLFEKIHGTKAISTDVQRRIGEPFVPDFEYATFRYYADEIATHKFAVFSSINGSGATTLVDRLANFVATDDDHILKIFGVMNFDLDYHRKFIGQEKDGVFVRGELFDFFDRCMANPDERFVLVFNDVHKIEPETFFGPDFWYKLYSPELDIKIDGRAIVIPDNFHMVSVSHFLPHAKVTLTNDHYRRIGQVYPLKPNDTELIFYLRNQLKTKELSAVPNIKPFVYAFNKSNEIVAEQFSKSYMLGQWSELRTLYDQEDINVVLDYFVDHVNSFVPRTEMTREDLRPVKYAIANQGRMVGSNFFSTQFKTLEEKGFLTEFIVGLSFILISALSSFYIFKQREKIISHQILMVDTLFTEFEDKTRGYDVISQEINQIKKQVDKLALKKKINYQEATFFYQYIYDKSRRIEIAKEARNHFDDLIFVSLNDGELSDTEYQKLLDFLNRIKTRIGAKDYKHFKAEIDRIHEEFSKN